MPEADGGGCCKCCFSFIFTSGLTALFLWLSLRPSKPKCSLQQFYIPALNRTLNVTTNTSLIFQFQLENTNKDKGVYYDPINVTFFDSPHRSHPIANFTIQNFYQGHKKKAKKGGNASIDKEAVFRAVFPNGSAIFRVDMVTLVRYKIISWQTKRHRIMVGADVAVNDQGTKVNKKGIKLKSGAAKMIGSCYYYGVLLINFLVLF